MHLPGRADGGDRPRPTCPVSRSTVADGLLGGRPPEPRVLLRPQRLRGLEVVAGGGHAHDRAVRRDEDGLRGGRRDVQAEDDGVAAHACPPFPWSRPPDVTSRSASRLTDEVDLPVLAMLGGLAGREVGQRPERLELGELGLRVDLRRGAHVGVLALLVVAGPLDEQDARAPVGHPAAAQARADLEVAVDAELRGGGRRAPRGRRRRRRSGGRPCARRARARCCAGPGSRPRRTARVSSGSQARPPGAIIVMAQPARRCGRSDVFTTRYSNVKRSGPLTRMVVSRLVPATGSGAVRRRTPSASSSTSHGVVVRPIGDPRVLGRGPQPVTAAQVERPGARAGQRHVGQLGEGVRAVPANRARTRGPTDVVTTRRTRPPRPDGLVSGVSLRADRHRALPSPWLRPARC